MPIASRRRPAAPPAVASGTVVTAVHTHLLDAPAGMSFAAIVDKARFERLAVAAALSVAVDTGLVRYSLEPAGLRFFAAQNVAHPKVDSTVIEAVMNFIGSHEDFERGSPDVTLGLDKLVQGLQGTYTVGQVLAALEALREEALVWFNLQPTQGTATITLSRHRYFTVVGRDDDAHQPLCFQVRAGTREVALQKVQKSAYASLELSLYGVTEGQIQFEGVPRHAGMHFVAL